MLLDECTKLMLYVTCILFVSNIFQCTICDMIINYEMLKVFDLGTNNLFMLMCVQIYMV